MLCVEKERPKWGKWGNKAVFGRRRLLSVVASMRKFAFSAVNQWARPHIRRLFPGTNPPKPNPPGGEGKRQPAERKANIFPAALLHVRYALRNFATTTTTTTS